MPFGAEFGANGVRFRLWAPDAESVSLELELSGARRDIPLQRDSNGWCEVLVADVGAGTRYQYLINGDLRVPDPASRYQPDDVHGASEVIDPAKYRWTSTSWRGRPWEEVVLYELHVGTFSPSGTFDGVRERLDYLVELGITAIELMPVADFPGRRNWGYDGVDLFAPDASYGRPEDLKALIDAAHGRGLMVFLDVVYNHFGPEGNYLHAFAKRFLIRTATPPGGRRSILTEPTARLSASSSFTTRFSGSKNIGSTVCGWTPFTQSKTIPSPIFSSNWPKGSARTLMRIVTPT
jgi:1,4-alpha-glucan branching enzyme/maltooligosyltrehalose trehalohydrolase